MLVVEDGLWGQVFVAPLVVVQMVKSQQHLLQIPFCQLLRKRAKLFDEPAQVTVSIFI